MQINTTNPKIEIGKQNSQKTDIAMILDNRVYTINLSSEANNTGQFNEKCEDEGTGSFQNSA
jgi:hypothetical protein